MWKRLVQQMRRVIMPFAPSPHEHFVPALGGDSSMGGGPGAKFIMTTGVEEPHGTVGVPKMCIIAQHQY